MLGKTQSRPATVIAWLCVIPLASILLVSSPVSAVTKSDMGTVVRLPDDAYRVAKPFLYEVKADDNLHWLAAKFYGDARQWERIYEANRDKIQDPNIPRVGQQLLIPANS